jgi:hypothetical protein
MHDTGVVYFREVSIKASKSLLLIGIVTLLSGAEPVEADTLQLKCNGTNADIRYSKVEIDGKIYYADKFGKIAVTNLDELVGKKITVYSAGNQGTVVQVARDGQVFAPCQ